MRHANGEDGGGDPGGGRAGTRTGGLRWRLGVERDRGLDGDPRAAEAGCGDPRESREAGAAEGVPGGGLPGPVGAFVDGLDGLRRELEVGLSYEGYAGEIDAIRKLYDRIPVKELTLACLSAAGTPGEHAFDRYVEAANTWNSCAAEPSCGSSRIEKPLQKEWHIAAHFVREAKRGLG